MASKNDSIINFLTGMFAIFAFTAFVAFLIINFEISRYKTEIAYLKGTPGQFEFQNGKFSSKDLISEKEELIVEILEMALDYSNMEPKSGQIEGFLQRYAHAFGKVEGVFPELEEYMDDGVPKPYTYKTKEGDEVVDSGLKKNISRINNATQDEKDEGVKHFNTAMEEIGKQPVIIKDQNKIIDTKLKDINKLEKHIVDIKIEADRVVKKLRDEYSQMNNELNDKVDRHIKNMDKKGRIHTEMKKRLDILKRREFAIVSYKDLLALSRKQLEIEADKESLKYIKHLDHEQLAEAVFQARNIDGKITLVEGAGASVIIDIGERNGVKVGQKFEVFELKDGVQKILHGHVVVKKVQNYFSTCSPLTIDNKVPLLVENYFVGDFQFTPNQKFEYVLVGEFKGLYTEEELEHIVKAHGGIIKPAIGYNTKYLVLGEKPEGDYPNEEIRDKMKDESLYNKKTLLELEKEFGFSKAITRYAVLFESSKEMGVKILDERKLLKLLKN